MVAFKPNKRGLDQLQRELQRELDKRPVFVRTEAEPGSVIQPAATVNHYHGPVVTVNGDDAQIAWGNETVNQIQSRVEQIAPGFEALARTMTDLLANLDKLGLDADDELEIRTTVETVLGEVVKAEPDKRILKRAATMIKGLLAPVGLGVGKAVTEESAEAARQVIENIVQTIPS
ncbi:hypothetical protein [Jiangella endophytica]|uniref:hypothetical protein n=1 Tax=Jiangella endophytica TaxID=1623398 RepID=UPI000E349DF2|nr:hypothetical protein [Jiangella endophytica]